MYIFKTLSTKIKEETFRCAMDKELSLDFNEETLKQNISIIENSSKGSRKLWDLSTDLLTYLKEGIHGNFEMPETRHLVSNIISLSKKIEKVINNVSPTTQELMFLLSEQSKNSCIVGGSVRDSILGEIPKDWDFVTDAHYDDVKELLESYGYTIKETGKQFLVMIANKNNETFEIAMYRKDGSYSDGRRPDSVEIGNLITDSERRDLTINALYYNISEKTIVDPTGQGINDISKKILRFVGSPKERIEEDKLRIIRFYRFLGRFKSKGFEPDSKSLKVCRTYFPEMMKEVAPTRVMLEVEKMAGLI